MSKEFKGISTQGFNWRMMYYNLVIGEFINDGSHIYFRPDKGIKEEWLPFFLRLPEEQRWNRPIEDLLHWWITERTYQKNRIGLRKYLRAMGLHKYDPFEMAMRSRCAQVTDNWWIAAYEDDGYTKIVPYAESRIQKDVEENINNKEEFRWMA